MNFHVNTSFTVQKWGSLESKLHRSVNMLCFPFITSSNPLRTSSLVAVPSLFLSKYTNHCLNRPVLENDRTKYILSTHVINHITITRLYRCKNTSTFTPVKDDKCQLFLLFLMFAQNIDFGYTLEMPK